MAGSSGLNRIAWWAAADRVVRPVEVRQNDGAMAESEGKVGVEHDRAVERAERGVIIAGELRQRQAGKIQHPRIIPGGSNCLPGQRDAFLDLRPNRRYPVPLTLHAAAQRDPRNRRTVGRIEFEGQPRKPDQLG